MIFFKLKHYDSDVVAFVHYENILYSFIYRLLNHYVIYPDYVH